MEVREDRHDFRPWHFDESMAVMRVKSEAKVAHIKARKLMSESVP